VLCVVAFGCGDNLLVEPDAGKAVFETAPHTPMPQLVPHGGQVLANVKLVTLTYTNYADKANVEAFGDAVVASDWYKQVTAEYGVSEGTHDAKVVIGPAPAMLTDVQVEAQIKQLINTNMVPKPLATGNQFLYMIYIPPSVTLDASLQGFYGYHAAAITTAGNIKFPYAVIIDDGTGIDTTTATAAHELVESATDPYDPPDDGYYVDPPLPDPWFLILGENADLCDGEDLIKSGTFAVQRIYSNAAAAAGKSPCIPFDPDDSWNDVSAEPATMPTIPAGGSATFTLTGWSTEEIDDWQIRTYDADFADLVEADITPQLSSDTINNGKTVTVTLHAPATATSGQLGGVYILSGDNVRPWAIGFIVQ
jgi:hypothetical protein